MKIKKFFTLMEILIIISLIILIGIIALIILNPKKQIEKAHDSKRKTELTQLQKTLEDWYNDKNCYPKPEEICYETNPIENSCFICGSENNSPNFNPYLKELPCDPQHPSKKYLYEVDDLNCPKKYWIYAKLSNSYDRMLTEENTCSGEGCGAGNDCSYNIAFSSPNTNIKNCETITNNYPTPTIQNSNLYCSNYNAVYIINNNICNICGSYQYCLNNNPHTVFYINSQCTQTCIKN
ncbi:MAG: hypothetical protein N2593_02875 [Patescibacteria group bacterium]|nr:hypothetical protein [Patescibacteria group bacterium]